MRPQARSSVLLFARQYPYFFSSPNLYCLVHSPLSIVTHPPVSRRTRPVIFICCFCSFCPMDSARAPRSQSVGNLKALKKGPCSSLPPPPAPLAAGHKKRKAADAWQATEDPMTKAPQQVPSVPSWVRTHPNRRAVRRGPQSYLIYSIP